MTDEKVYGFRLPSRNMVEIPSKEEFDALADSLEGSSDVITVTSGTPSGTKFGIVSSSGSDEWLCILPISTHKYTGSIQVKNLSTSSKKSVGYITEFGTSLTNTRNTLEAGSSQTITFTNASCLYLIVGNGLSDLSLGSLTLS